MALIEKGGTVAEAVAFNHQAAGAGYSETKTGGTGPKNYDCSGLQQQALKAAHITVARTTTGQWVTPALKRIAGPGSGPGTVSIDQARAGDLLMYAVPGDGGALPQHEAMYLGGGQQSTAPHTGETVGTRSVPTDSSTEWLFGILRPPYSTAGATTEATRPNTTSTVGIEGVPSPTSGTGLTGLDMLLSPGSLGEGIIRFVEVAAGAALMALAIVALFLAVLGRDVAPAQLLAGLIPGGKVLGAVWSRAK